MRFRVLGAAAALGLFVAGCAGTESRGQHVRSDQRATAAVTSMAAVEPCIDGFLDPRYISYDRAPEEPSQPASAAVARFASQLASALQGHGTASDGRSTWGVHLFFMRSPAAAQRFGAQLHGAMYVDLSPGESPAAVEIVGNVVVEMGQSSPALEMVRNCLGQPHRAPIDRSHLATAAPAPLAGAAPAVTALSRRLESIPTASTQSGATVLAANTDCLITNRVEYLDVYGPAAERLCSGATTPPGWVAVNDPDLESKLMVATNSCFLLTPVSRENVHVHPVQQVDVARAGTLCHQLVADEHWTNDA